MMNLAFFLEEPSAKELLRGLIPRLLSAKEVETHYIIFQGKQDLERQLARKLRGWRRPNTAFVVLRDQDAGRCEEIKQRLADLCQQAGRQGVLIRIACREIESWYLGDLVAVEAAFELPGLGKKQQTKKFRRPDRLHHPSVELEQLTRGRYQKISGSRKIAPLLGLEGKNLSASFCSFVSGLTALLQEARGDSDMQRP